MSELSLASENEANSESNSGNENSEQSSKVLKLKDLKKIIILVASTTNECSLWKKRITEARNMFVENEKNLFQRQRSSTTIFTFSITSNNTAHIYSIFFIFSFDFIFLILFVLSFLTALTFFYYYFFFFVKYGFIIKTISLMSLNLCFSNRAPTEQAQFGACGRILVTVLEGANLKTVSGKNKKLSHWIICCERGVDFVFGFL